MPGPNERSQAATSAAYPSGSGRGSGRRPSHAVVAVQRGREIFQPPSFSPRTIAPDAASATITCEAIAMSAW